MARKRKSSDMSEPKAGLPRQTEQLDPVADDFKALCKKAGIEHADYLEASPIDSDKVNIKHQLSTCYRFLWWQHQAGLQEAERQFFADLELNEFSHYNRFQKTVHLLKKLIAAKDEGLAMCTPRTKKTYMEHPSKAAKPVSPTRIRGPSIFDHFGVSKSFVRPESPEPIPQSPLLAKSAMGPLDLPDASTTTPGNISFNTDATRSFKNTSFWSNASPHSSQDTEITEFSQDFAPSMSKRSSEFSSLTPSVAMEMIELADELESSQGGINKTEQIIKAPKIPKGDNTFSGKLEIERTMAHRESQSTDYGSSIGSREVDLLQTGAEASDNGQAALHSAESYSRRILVENSGFESVRPKLLEGRLSRVVSFNSRSDTAMIDGVLECAYPGASQDDHIGNTKCRNRSPRHGPTSINVDAPAPEDFFGLKIPSLLRQSPFELQYAMQIVLQTGKISPEELENNLIMPNLEALHRLLADREIRSTGLRKPNDLKDYEVMTRNAKLQWAKSKPGPCLDMHVLPARRDTACSLQRRLGADRVLYVDIPDLNKPPQLFKGKKVQTPFREWLRSPHTFLGAKWYLFFLQPIKKKSGYSDKATGIAATDESVTALHRLIFVSPKPGETICDIINWCLPLATNGQQTARKAYMRLELQLSRTVVAAVLRPEEITLVPDQIATNDPDDRQFEDMTLSHEFHEHLDNVNPTVMNDGCNEIAYWIAYSYAKIVGIPKIPPCLQIRAAGAKGLWYIGSTDYRAIEKRPQGALIKLSPSQIKVFRETFSGCDDDTLSVCVVKHNPLPKSSILHILFLPILINRGVPREAICELVDSQARHESAELLQALQAADTAGLRDWIHKQREFHEAKTRERGIETLCGFPRSIEEKVILMLESGFDPKHHKFLANEVTALVKTYFDLQKKNFKIHLAKSATLWGIADPVGVLAPGEVNVVFGAPFDNPATGESWWYLDGMEGLISRNPALAPWDIQKVRFVFRPELARFTNHVVFPSKGMRPLANKLQGGDYDGDQFWFTWEEKLVKPFKNAPAPWQPPDPEVFGIKKDKSLLFDHIKDGRSEVQLMTWLANMAVKRMDANMLGNVTLYLERLNYGQGTIDTEHSKMLTHLHDYLVDSDKQGYDFDQAAFDAWRRTVSLPSNPATPDYWRFTRAECDKVYYVPNKVEVNHNIIDTVYFDVLEPIIKDTFRRMSDVLCDAGPFDADLSKFYTETLESEPPDSPARKELLRLKEKLGEIRKAWVANTSQNTFQEHVEKLRVMYDEIQPMKIKEWLRRPGRGYSTWDNLKASCFAKTQYFSHERPGQLIFNVAGKELCELKIHELGLDYRTVVQRFYNSLQWRKPRRIEIVDDFDEEPGESEEAGEHVGYY